MATRKPKPQNVANSLATVLKALAPIQGKTGLLKEQFCNISYGWACASNDIVTIGVPIDMNLFACPHFVTFSKALTECEADDLSITQIDAETLVVNSGDMKARVPCVDPSRVEIPAPDPNIAVVGNGVKAALAACATVTDAEHQNPAFMGVLLQSGSTVGINGHIMLEYWHGVDLPPNLLIPKESATIIGKCKKNMNGFGFSESSVTFWFDDGSFIKSQLLRADYPNYQSLFPSYKLNTIKLHKMFERGVKNIKNFAPEGNVYFFEGTLQTNVRTTDASTFKIEGLPEGMAFSVKYLLTMVPYMEEVYFQKEAKRAFVFTQNTRGVIMGIGISDEDLPNYKASNKDKPLPNANYDPSIEDDIPF